MSDIKIDTCPICGGHSFSPLAAGQYMCTQCGYVANSGLASSQVPSSSSDSLQESPLSTEEELSPEVNMNQTRCPRCGSVVDKGLNFCPKCGFRFAQVNSSSLNTDEYQAPDEDKPKKKHGLFYKILKWIGIVYGSIFVFFIVGGLAEVCFGDDNSEGIEQNDSSYTDSTSNANKDSAIKEQKAKQQQTSSAEVKEQPAPQKSKKEEIRELGYQDGVTWGEKDGGQFLRKYIQMGVPMSEALNRLKLVARMGYKDNYGTDISEELLCEFAEQFMEGYKSVVVKGV